MSVTVDALKEMAINGMEAAYGEPVGKAYGFLMFGGYGVPGLVDGATLALKANSISPGNDFTADMAISLVADSAKVGLTAFLEKTSANALADVGVTAEAVASASLLVVTGVFQSSEIGPEAPPPNPIYPPSPFDPDTPISPVVPVPVNPDPVNPDPVDPDPVDPDPTDPDPADPVVPIVPDPNEIETASPAKRNETEPK